MNFGLKFCSGPALAYKLISIDDARACKQTSRPQKTKIYLVGNNVLTTRP